eukprot:COSAG02_NODE_36384_length_455_cov_0.862360_2_plen_34_part_01
MLMIPSLNTTVRICIFMERSKRQTDTMACTGAGG